MEEEVKERLISRVNTNPYVNHLGIQFTVVEEGRIEARMPLLDEHRQYSGVIHGGVLPWPIRLPVLPLIRCFRLTGMC